MQKLGRALTPKAVAERGRSIWRWREFLPIEDEVSIVSLGEGDSPLIASVYAGPRLGLDRLFFKNDTVMPTGSFKDRGFSVAVSRAKEQGVRRGLTYSSGNAGASCAAYSSRAGLDVAVLVEHVANPAKVASIGLYGGRVAILEFDDMEQITEMLERAVQELEVYQFVNFINPIRHEGMKTYAYEVSEELGWDPPDVMIHPVGTGGGIWGAWKGFQELLALGWTSRMPQMVAVQPASTGYVEGAFRRGLHRAEPRALPGTTIAQSIAGNAPIKGGERVLRAVYDSHGWADAVSDDEILEAMRWLGREGICAEPAGAASLAALIRAVGTGRLRADTRVVCVITGNGLKQPGSLQQAVSEPTLRLKADYDELRRLLDRIWGHNESRHDRIPRLD